MYNDDVKYLRDMAWKIREFSLSRENEIIIKRWRDVTAMRRPDRMPVYTFPSGAVWDEIIPEDSYKCPPGFLRELEFTLRGRLYKIFVGDDTTQTPFYPVHAVYDVRPANTWGVDINNHMPDRKGGAWAFNPPIAELEDFSKLKVPEFTYNAEETARRIEEVNEVLGDILPAKFRNYNLLPLSHAAQAAMLRGLENMLIDIKAEPEFLHKLMEYITESILKSMDTLEETGLITPNTEGDHDYVGYCDPVGEPDQDGKYTLKNCWYFADSQEFEPVSPRDWEEFSLSHQKKIFERYGLIHYGCCERLEKKVDKVMTIPNLRMIAASHFTNLRKLVDRTGDKYVIQWRPSPINLIFGYKEKMLAELSEGAEILKGVQTQIMMRSVETLGGNPNLQKEWTELAKDFAVRI